MQSTQKLTRALSALITLIEEEASQNPEFAQKLEAALGNLPEIPKKKAKQSQPDVKKIDIPDVLEALQNKGDSEFKFWLREFDVTILKAIIKQNGFDLGKKSQRWKEPDKFIELIASQTSARLNRGSAFLTPKDH